MNQGIGFNKGGRNIVYGGPQHRHLACVSMPHSTLAGHWQDAGASNVAFLGPNPQEIITNPPSRIPLWRHSKASPADLRLSIFP
jgi:hypothetical protein